MTAPPRQTMLATAPVSKLIWTFAIPAILSQVVNSMHNIVDQTFLGWGIGDLAIAATNIAFPLSTLTTALAALIGMGGAAGFSLDLGKKQARSARKNWGNAIVLSVGLGCLLADHQYGAALCHFLHGHGPFYPGRRQPQVFQRGSPVRGHFKYDF